MSNYTLEILPLTPEIAEFYRERTNFSTDAGVDLYNPSGVTISPQESKLIGFGIKCRMVDSNNNTVSYYLYPRSSIFNTPLSLANSVGIIDKDYRGEIKGGFRNIVGESDYTIERGIRLCQITHPSLCPLSVKIVDNLDDTLRGEGGFGSTGK